MPFFEYAVGSAQFLDNVESELRRQITRANEALEIVGSAF